MRVSLYKHELEIASSLTLQLTRLLQEERPDLAIETVAPDIFLALVDGLYTRGNYKRFRYEDESHAQVRT